jgi:protein-S-isoprenylcysteine O-methyltransferase Ste14
MDKNIFWVLVIICCLTHVIRSVYEILKHKKMLKANKTTFVIIFTNMMLLWGSWFLLCANDYHKIELPGIIRYIGLAFIFTGGLIFFISLFTIKTLESYEGDLITSGIYSIIRHPMYLGFILWITGSPVFFGASYALVLAVIFIANVLFWRHLEERELIERFSSYSAYRKTTLF